MVLFILVLSIGLVEALVLSPQDYKQSHSVRIMYVHVPGAWISLGIFSSITFLSLSGYIFKNKNFFDSKEVSQLSKLLPGKKINILEIGFGDGNNLIEKAMANSNMNFYGIEVFKSGIASVLKQVQIQDLKNICLFYGDAKDFLEKIEKPFFDFIFILFPDPWPKKKHLKKRLINQK